MVRRTTEYAARDAGIRVLFHYALFEIIPRNGDDALEMPGSGTGIDEEFSPEMEYSNQARP